MYIFAQALMGNVANGYNILKVSISLNTKEIAIGNFNHGTSEV